MIQKGFGLHNYKLRNLKMTTRNWRRLTK